MDPCGADNVEPHGGGQRATPPPKVPQRSSTASPSQDSKVVHSPKVDSGEKNISMASPANPSCGRLVYVRRRVEVDTSKGSIEAKTQPKEQSLSSTKSAVPEGPSSHRLGWEERYHHLQMLLKKLNESDQTEHVQMLWSLSSSELSKHAVELEKRSIQLSLEEAREMQRVAALNVLGKSVNTLK